jgi:hypothetical protein
VAGEQAQEGEEVGHAGAEAEIGRGWVGGREDERDRSHPVPAGARDKARHAGLGAQRPAGMPRRGGADRVNRDGDAAGRRVRNRIERGFDALLAHEPHRARPRRGQVEGQQLRAQRCRPRPGHARRLQADPQPLLARRRRGIARIPCRQVEPDRSGARDLRPPRIAGRPGARDGPGEAEQPRELGEQMRPVVPRVGEAGAVDGGDRAGRRPGQRRHVHEVRRGVVRGGRHDAEQREQGVAGTAVAHGGLDRVADALRGNAGDGRGVGEVDRRIRGALQDDVGRD